MKKVIILSTLILLLSACGKDEVPPVTKAPLTFENLAFQVNGLAAVGQNVTFTRLLRRPRDIGRRDGAPCEFSGKDVSKTVVDIRSNGKIIVRETQTLSVLIEGDTVECTLRAKETSTSCERRVNQFEARGVFNKLKADFEESCKKSCAVTLENQLINGQVQAVLTTQGYVRGQGLGRRGGFGQEAFETKVRVLNTVTPWLSTYKSISVSSKLYYTGGSKLSQRDHTVTLGTTNDILRRDSDFECDRL